MMRFWKRVLCVFFMSSLCSSVNSEDLDLISRLYLSDKKYAKNIEVRAYLVTRDQLMQALSDENSEIVQKKNRELFDEEVYLLIRCKNFGDYQAFGTLNCRLRKGIPLSLQITVLPGYMKSFYSSAVVRMTEGIFPNDDGTPVITYKWKSLYTI